MSVLSKLSKWWGRLWHTSKQQQLAASPQQVLDEQLIAEQQSDPARFDRQPK